MYCLTEIQSMLWPQAGQVRSTEVITVFFSTDESPCSLLIGLATPDHLGNDPREQHGKRDPGLACQDTSDCQRPHDEHREHFDHQRPILGSHRYGLCARRCGPFGFPRGRQIRIHAGRVGRLFFERLAAGAAKVAAGVVRRAAVRTVDRRSLRFRLRNLDIGLGINRAQFAVLGQNGSLRFGCTHGKFPHIGMQVTRSHIRTGGAPGCRIILPARK